ncbi:MAG: hypothetical protein FJ144_11775 [Deltaproteobacteria bacterium]|nr:hypothetical protein [Deltaproteobacteria bacterium]
MPDVSCSPTSLPDTVIGECEKALPSRIGSVLRDPIGRLHWAGTGTATRSNGFIDGAIRAGERAASEVLAAD